MYTRDRSTPRPDTYFLGKSSITAAAGSQIQGVTTIAFRKKVVGTVIAELGKIDCNRYSICDILYFLFVECTGAFSFLNEYRIRPCLYLFFFFSAQIDIPYSILFVQVTLSHFSQFKITVGISLPWFC